MKNSRCSRIAVIPAKAGIHVIVPHSLDSRLRGNDNSSLWQLLSRFYLKKISVFSAAALLSLSAYAKPTIEREGFWNILSFNGTVNQQKTWLYQAEFQSRFIFQNPVYDRNVLRFGFGRVLSESLSLWFGYDATSFLDGDKRLRLEQRVWPQLIWRVKQKKLITLDSRSRLEFIKQLQHSEIALRFRERLTIDFSVAPQQKVIPTIYDEIFFNLNHPQWVSSETLSQNRIFLGASVPIAEKVKLLAGYLNRYQWDTSGNALSHILYIEFNFSRG